MNSEIYESLPTSSATVHMLAGAIAGVMEHCVMYPIDSVKTRMQTSPPGPGGGGGVREILSRMVRQEGLLRPVRGMSVIVVGAGPAHALYFSCYESVKNTCLRAKRIHSEFNVLVYAFAGCMATILHDGIMNPAEVVKQRLQMYNSPYRDVMSCINNVYKREGASAFYRSYTTQLAMNVPFQSIHFITYEVSQSMVNPRHNYNPAAHMLSGAIAGAVAAAATTPLDVCKTLLNTQQNGIHAVGMLDAFRKVYGFGGLRGYFRGLYARVLYQIPATAICWTTYESFKYVLRNQDDGQTGSESDDDSTTMSQNQSASSRSNCLENVPLQFNMNY